MPGKDKTGPLGEGSLTGRGLGRCSGKDTQATGRGPGRGAGRGLGRGLGRRLGRGLGRLLGNRSPVNDRDGIREEIQELETRLAGLKSALAETDATEDKKKE